MEKRIKKSYICRDVHNYKLNQFFTGDYVPKVGDVGVFEILTIGKHNTMQSDKLRNCTIIPGDYIMAAFGTRYATEQFEGYLPENCMGELHILGAGGTVGVVCTMHAKFENIGPTTLKYVGKVENMEGEIINTKAIYQENISEFTGVAKHLTKVILSIGSSMDSGKTTTAANFVNGLKREGYSVAFIKLTGTVFTKDCNLNYDLGADMALDFSEYGFPSTYLCDKSELLNIYESLILKLNEDIKPDYVVMEIADGIYQRETKMLLQDKSFMDTIYGVIFSAGDSLAAINGVQILRNWGIKLGFLSGLFTASPLLTKEVEENTNVPIYGLSQLRENAQRLLPHFEKEIKFSVHQMRKVS